MKMYEELKPGERHFLKCFYFLILSKFAEVNALDFNLQWLLNEGQDLFELLNSNNAVYIIHVRANTMNACLAVKIELILNFQAHHLRGGE